MLREFEQLRKSQGCAASAKVNRAVPHDDGVAGSGQSMGAEKNGGRREWILFQVLNESYSLLWAVFFLFLCFLGKKMFILVVSL